MEVGLGAIAVGEFLVHLILITSLQKQNVKINISLSFLENSLFRRN